MPTYASRLLKGPKTVSGAVKRAVKSFGKKSTIKNKTAKTLIKKAAKKTKKFY